MLGVRIFYRYTVHETVRNPDGWIMRAAPGHGVVRLGDGSIADVTDRGLRRRVTCGDWLDVPYAGGDLDDYMRRFNQRTLFDDHWVAHVSHCSTTPRDHAAYNAYFVHRGQRIQGLDDAETLRTTPRERQVQAALRDRLYAARPEDISNREYRAA